MPDSTNLRRILVAEDNDNARLILTDLCRMFGYEVDAVAHGMAAGEAAVIIQRASAAGRSGAGRESFMAITSGEWRSPASAPRP
jgi:hypothetical protein